MGVAIGTFLGAAGVYLSERKFVQAGLMLGTDVALLGLGHYLYNVNLERELAKERTA